MNKLIKQVSEANNSMGKYGNYINPETAERFMTDELFVLFEIASWHSGNRKAIVKISTMYSPKKIFRIIRQHYSEKYFSVAEFNNGGYELDIRRPDLRTLEEKY